MSSSASVPGQRRTARGGDDAANKKKQKDRANQECKEGERPAVSDSRKDLPLDWKQNADEVIVKLNLGSRIPKVDSSFTDTGCVIKLPDGRQWSCEFCEEIESSCIKVQYKKSNVLQLVLPKKIPLHNWASLSKLCKDGSREQSKRAAWKENGKEKGLLVGEESQPETVAEPTRGKRELANPKRASGRSEVAGEGNPVSPGLPTGPSAKRAVCLNRCRACARCSSSRSRTKTTKRPR